MPAGTPLQRAVTPVTAALITMLSLGGCASAPEAGSTAPARAPIPLELQADAVATREFGLLAGGGWAQAWALWNASAQQVIRQADFVRLNTVCRPALGVPYVVAATTRIDQETVRVDWRRADAVGSNTLLYQAGSWRFVPDAASLADYRLGVDALVRKRRAAGSCH
ncbi:hypothetical protein [Streptacidiphilus rugosus]|uniref:hypothetical protein n=1 Tax=Streptacidiphilus rugosus TaxID=405783 RepID=UPI00056C645E|nr:hypothetical protein [Streptacidiphilus rugosus]